MGPAVGRYRIPDVVVGGGRIEVAGQHEGLVPGAGFLEPARKPLEPAELALVPGRPDDPPVRRIEAGEPDPAGDGGDHPRLVGGIEVLLVQADRRAGPGIAHGPVAEVRDRILEPDPAGDRDAVPASLAVVEELVPRDREREDGRVLVGELRLLHQQDVRVRPLDPAIHGLLAGLERVDVPGRDPHDGPQ
jgi:hypothetical protein